MANKEESRSRTITVRIDPNFDDGANIFEQSNVTRNTRITKIQRKAPDHFVIECADATEANKLQTTIANTFGPRINAQPAQQSQPLIKITNLPTNLDEATFIEDVRAYNFWLEDQEMELVRSYQVSLPARSYRNAIIAVSVSTLKLILKQGAILFGVKTRPCFESVNTLQCTNCCRFGHTKHNCDGQLTCRLCAGPHEYTTCKSATAKCVNCVTYNSNPRNTTKHSFAHIATSEKCPCRIARIDGLKAFYGKKN